MMNKHQWLIVLLAVSSFLFGASLTYSFTHDDQAGYQIQIAALQSELQQRDAYQADLAIYGLDISNVSPEGFYVTFQTTKSQPLVVEYTVWPSDMFQIVYCGTGKFHDFWVETYPEGGTVMYRITDGINWMPQHGTEWLYQDLPRPEGETVLPPPYK